MASKTDPTPAPDAVVKLTEEITRIDVEVEERQTRRKQLVDTIAQLVDEPGTYAAGSAQVIVKPGPRRLDKARFIETYPPEKFPELYKQEPDTTAAKHDLGAKALDPLYGAPGARQVIVK